MAQITLGETARAVSCMCLLEHQALGSLSGRMRTAISACPPTSRQEVTSSYFYSRLQPHHLPHRHWLSWGLSRSSLVSLTLDRTTLSALPSIKPFPVSTASGRCYTQVHLAMDLWTRRLLGHLELPMPSPAQSHVIHVSTASSRPPERVEVPRRHVPCHNPVLYHVFT